MTGHAYHAYVVCKIFTAELGAETKTMCSLEKFLLQFDIAESMTVFIALGRKIVIIFDRRFLHCGKISLGRSTAYNKSYMVRRTCRRAQSLHLLDQERHKSLLIKNSFGFLIKISLVRRTSTLGDKEEFILIALSGMNLYLGREITACIHLVIHIQRCVLRVTQVIFSICFVDTIRDLFLVVTAGPYLLTFISGAYGCTGILTERQYPFGCHLRIAKHGQSNVSVIFRRLRIVKDFRDHLIMLPAKHERAIM